jgi:hypothetical protein
MDTRPGATHTGPIVGPVVGGALTNKLPIAGVSVPANATAVVLNVTATGPTASSFLTVYPDGTDKPLASNLNFVSGQTVPNLVTVQLGTDGGVTFFNNSGNVQVIADLAGYFTAAGDTSGSHFYPLVNHRILDTRTNTGGIFTSIGAGQTKNVAVVGQGGVIDGAASVVMNTTVTAPTASSFLTVYPDDKTQPLASNLNFVKDLTVANLVSAKVGASSGNVDVFNNRGSVQVIVDVAGWYGTAPTAP